MDDSSRRWHDYFVGNSGPVEFDWADPCFLSDIERAAVAASVQQFQLGESSEGRAFLRRGQQRFVPALSLFIAEEQRHAHWLGRFLDRERIPRLERHWVDGVFRWLRKLAGLEVCVTVLATAECIAVPYYRALHDATASSLLKKICRRILREEAAHLEYQASTLAALSRDRSASAASLRYALHAAFLAVTSIVVWHEHRRVFRASKYCWLRLCSEAMLELSRMEAEIAPATQGRADAVVAP